MSVGHLLLVVVKIIPVLISFIRVIAWPKWRPLLSWITGWVNVSGWIALVASGGLLGSQLIVGIISFVNQSYKVQRWHQFLIYIGYNLVAFLLNAFGNSLLPYVTKGAFAWSITGFVIISITVLACASPNYSSGKYVFTEFINGMQVIESFRRLVALIQE